MFPWQPKLVYHSENCRKNVPLAFKIGTKWNVLSIFAELSTKRLIKVVFNTILPEITHIALNNKVPH